MFIFLNFQIILQQTQLWRSTTSCIILKKWKKSWPGWIYNRIYYNFGVKPRKMSYSIVECSFQTGIAISFSETRVYNLHTKWNKPKYFLKKLIPILLLSILYETGSLTVSKRMKSVLDIIINEDQRGFKPSKYVGEISRFVFDLME